MRPIKLACQDHQGADIARVQQWDGKEWKIISDYYKADQTILDPMVKERGQVRRGEEDHAARLLQGELSQVAAEAASAPSQRAARRRPRKLPDLLRAVAVGRSSGGRRCSVSADESPWHCRTPQPRTATDFLSVNNIEVIYDHVILVLKGVSLAVPQGRHRRAARRQRRRQDHDAEGDLQPAARRARRGDQGLDRVRRRARSHDALAQRAGAARLHPGDGGPPLLRATSRSRRTC